MLNIALTIKNMWCLSMLQLKICGAFDLIDKKQPTFTRLLMFYKHMLFYNKYFFITKYVFIMLKQKEC